MKKIITAVIALAVMMIIWGAINIYAESKLEKVDLEVTHADGGEWATAVDSKGIMYALEGEGKKVGQKFTAVINEYGEIISLKEKITTELVRVDWIGEELASAVNDNGDRYVFDKKGLEVGNVIQVKLNSLEHLISFKKISSQR